MDNATAAPATAPGRYRLLFILLALFAFTGDLASKYAVFGWLYNKGDGGRYTVVQDGFDIIAQYEDNAAKERVPRVNRGALFGIGNGREGGANTFFAVVSILAASFILVWGLKGSTSKDFLLSAALGLILGGTLGNFYDRMVFGGVRDFLYYHYLFEWPVFNFADCCLVVGAGLLLIQALFSKQPEKKQEERQARIEETLPPPNGP